MPVQSRQECLLYMGSALVLYVSVVMASRSIFLALFLLTACQKELVIPVRSGKTDTVTTTVAAEPKDLGGQKVDTTVPLPDPISRCAVNKTSAPATERIELTMWLNEAPEKLQVGVRVLRQDREVASAQVPAEGKKVVTVKLPPLEPGKYRVEGLWGGNRGCELDIEITR